ncbi:PREDICTED: mitochondrial outer membrane protein porin 4-like [Tarenaya hassleriana]|uniref:mitochondrial outer membrane protein porin 4-like n=1 Tax=Tarenaya hassleriana TaxID=28532 RepID=UPI00053C65A1|nr:PREDICTED: mitochondrial outer membrane protein porin 4-like [Tarenaya hassleriana]
MGGSPAPFADIGKKAKDLLNKDYIFDQKFTLTMLSATGTELVATGLKKDEFFFGDLSTLYKGKNTIVDMKIDSYSNMSAKVTVNNLLPTAKASISFRIPDHKSGKLDVQYVHPHATINSSIGLNPTPLLDISATIGSQDLCLGGEVGFDTATASLTKCNVGIGLNKTDFSTALILGDKGETLKASYVHTVNQNTAIGAELTHSIYNYNSSTFTIGSSHAVDSFTAVKTRFSDKGRAGIVVQREWRPNSLVTFSAEYDPKAAVNASPRLGLALALKP